MKGAFPVKKSLVTTIVAIGIGAALFFVLGRFVAIPSPVPNTNISLQYGLLAFMAALFGPVAGVLIGFIGHALIDFSFGWGIWWSWVIASACFGALIGLVSRKLALADGLFTRKDAVRFNLFQIVGHILAWGLIAPALDILIYAEPANKVFLQGLVGGIANIVTTAVVGTLLCVAYAAAKPKKGSLKEEQ
ncbi:MAG: ECF-type riboflavin transporter substrate-binding protein [Oscillospiraceae bacterium]|nr:ECF-type riboflavin transporter substrate-binding protein [Oscillospiraceae bacterium]